MTTLELEQQVKVAIAEARTACSTRGYGSHECAASWDAVDELQMALAAAHDEGDRLNTLNHYCEDHPEAQECLIYDV